HGRHRRHPAEVRPIQIPQLLARLQHPEPRAVRVHPADVRLVTDLDEELNLRVALDDAVKASAHEVGPRAIWSEVAVLGRQDHGTRPVIDELLDLAGGAAKPYRDPEPRDVPPHPPEEATFNVVPAVGAGRDEVGAEGDTDRRLGARPRSEQDRHEDDDHHETEASSHVGSVSRPWTSGGRRSGAPYPG